MEERETIYSKLFNQNQEQGRLLPLSARTIPVQISIIGIVQSEESTRTVKTVAVGGMQGINNAESC